MRSRGGCRHPARTNGILIKMAIERFGEGGAMERRVGLKAAAKKAAKHPAKKHAAKKQAAKKQAAKHVGDHNAEKLAKAFHHLERAASVVSLLEAESGGYLNTLLEHSVRVYRIATASNAKEGAAVAAHGLARAAEHLAMAGLYMARQGSGVKARTSDEELHRMERVRERMAGLRASRGESSRWLQGVAAELIEHAATLEDLHVKWELVMAADGISAALEAGM